MKFLFNVYRGPLPRGKSGRSVKLATQFRLVSRLKVNAATPNLLHMSA